MFTRNQLSLIEAAKAALRSSPGRVSPQTRHKKSQTRIKREFQTLVARVTHVLPGARRLNWGSAGLPGWHLPGTEELPDSEATLHLKFYCCNKMPRNAHCTLPVFPHHDALGALHQRLIINVCGWVTRQELLYTSCRSPRHYQYQTCTMRKRLVITHK